MMIRSAPGSASANSAAMTVAASTHFAAFPSSARAATPARGIVTKAANTMVRTVRTTAMSAGTMSRFDGTTKNCIDGASTEPPRNMSCPNPISTTTPRAATRITVTERRCPANGRLSAPSPGSAQAMTNRAHARPTITITDGPSTGTIGDTTSPNPPKKNPSARLTTIGNNSSQIAVEPRRPAAARPCSAATSPVTTARTTTSVRGSTRVSKEMVWAAEISSSAASAMPTAADTIR